MPKHSDATPGIGPDEQPDKIDASQGFEPSDVREGGIVIFLVALAVLVAVIGALSYGIGKVINAHLKSEDGAPNKWTQTVDVQQLGNMPSNPELQNKVAEITQTFPTPRVQTDNGNQDIVTLHAREDILLDNYTWVDRSKGTVRIPIERAMELVAQRGLPVAPAVKTAPLMTGDAEPVVQVPLTSGFARTAYEEEQEMARELGTRDQAPSTRSGDQKIGTRD
jgi:hypothetical protein